MLLSAFNTTGHGKDAHSPRLLAFNGGNGFMLFIGVDLDQGKLTSSDVSFLSQCRNAELIRPEAAVCGFIGVSGVK